MYIYLSIYLSIHTHTHIYIYIYIYIHIYVYIYKYVWLYLCRRAPGRHLCSQPSDRLHAFCSRALDRHVYGAVPQLSLKHKIVFKVQIRFPGTNNFWVQITKKMQRNTRSSPCLRQPRARSSLRRAPTTRPKNESCIQTLSL